MSPLNSEIIQHYGGPGPRYTSYPPADRFHEEISAADFDHAVALGNQARRPLSLYLHVPFCGSVCYYCACNRIITGNHARADEYVPLLKREIRHKARHVDSQRPVVQMHWGGGTPTYLSDAQITELVYDLARHFPLLDDDRGDYAIEIDPRTVNESRLGLLRGLGFNRISLGVQDLDPRVQQAVNRVQPYEMIRDVMGWARDFGFRSINTDLIYGLPWQSESSLARTIEQLLTLRPDRVSLYNYAHMPARFKVQKQIPEMALPSPSEKLSMLVRATEMFRRAGYRLIGMDHFALPEDDLAQAQENGTLHRNFQGYTLHGEADLLGLGVSAISQIGRFYGQNWKSLNQWQCAVLDDALPLERGYLLNDDDALRREVIMRLLCDMRLDMEEIGHRWKIEFTDYFLDALAQMADLELHGLIRRDGDSLQVTEVGRLVVRAIVQPFDRYRRLAQEGRFSRII
ncbi:coproporphyrinogen III oxidase [Alcanivorax hongdengensis A-11-3]|uniref:Coproporphyrinogen-III oxidase n=1 Tax=Alcanivorax hongdengensis A-11-3 TaxID=1177179 RepID=L0WD58_9GAMM|nr:oxygen-independent coproporphyrinogen III oxidase [Alcanivorax hongdengensis]EKF74047.1 coproporphyrinogen III oxidase [Alcanivorax hongdengensis A-11-3]